MFKFQFPAASASSILDSRNERLRQRVEQLYHLSFGIKTDRRYLDKHRQREMSQDEFPEIHPIPPYDDPLY
jgi:hypothetical protein